MTSENNWFGEVRAAGRRTWEEFLGGQVSPPAAVGRAGVSPDGSPAGRDPGIDRAAAPASC